MSLKEVILILNDNLLRIMDNYLKEREKPYAGSQLGDFVRHDCKNEVLDFINDDRYTVRASVGQGYWAHVPWIAIYDKNLTANTTIGFFVVFLFSEDMSTVYLSLSLGFRVYQVKFGNDYLKHLRNDVSYLQNKVQRKYFDNYIFNIEGVGDFNDTCIIAKKYSKEDLKADKINIESDLNDFLDIYKYLINEEILIPVETWKSLLKDETIFNDDVLKIFDIILNTQGKADTPEIKTILKEWSINLNEKSIIHLMSVAGEKISEKLNRLNLIGFNEDFNLYWLFNETNERSFELKENLKTALIEIKNEEGDNEKIGVSMTKMWMVRAGKGGKFINSFEDKNLVVIGWGELGDLTKIKSKDELIELFDKTFPKDTKAQKSANAGMVWKFIKEFNIGDYVVSYNSFTKKYSVGKIISGYTYFDKPVCGKTYNNVRNVEWISHVSKDALKVTTQNTLGSLRTIFDLTGDAEKDILNVMKKDIKKTTFFDFLEDEGFYFDKELIENFLLSLKVKPFLILTGNSGTGKTKLAQLFAKYITKSYFEKSLDTETFDDEVAMGYKIVPVGSNWIDNSNILGYYNVITNKYQRTPALELIMEAKENYNLPYFLILDEMNLSHVERYFADYLSAIESGESIPLYSDEENNDSIKETESSVATSPSLKNKEYEYMPKELELPENLFTIGTVNVDETTYMFSPKVLDRSNTIEFSTQPVESFMEDKLKIERPDKGFNLEYLESLEDTNLRKMNMGDLKSEFNNNVLWSVLSSELEKFRLILKKSGFDFGFRVTKEIVCFIVVAYKYENKSHDFNLNRYLDAQIKQKLLPKLHGSEKSIGNTLISLFKLCLNEENISENPDMVLSKEDIINMDLNSTETKYYASAVKLQEMIKILSEQKYVSFID